MRSLGLALALAGCFASMPSQPVRIGNAEPIPQNAAYRSLSAALLISDASRATLLTLSQGLETARAMNPNLSFDVEKPMRDVDGLFAANFKSVARIKRLEDLAQVRVDLVAVLHLAVQVGAQSGQATRFELALEIMTPDRRPLERLRGAGEAPIPFPANSLMLDEAESQAFQQLAAAVMSSRAIAALVAAPSSDGSAREHHARALKAFDLGKFDEAIKEWQAAYEIDPRAQVLYNLARCYHRRGELTRAVADFKQARHFYVRFQSNAKDPDVSEDLRDVDAQIAWLGN